MPCLTLGSYLARIRTVRAAVVPYVVNRDKDGNKRIYFLFARDRETGDVTDLGGGVKQYECSLSAGLREFKEESDEIFGSLYDNINDMGLLFALTDDRMSVLFLPLEQEWYDLAPDLFRKKRNTPSLGTRKKSHEEVSELLWIDEDEFLRLLYPDNRKMWRMIRRFYQKAYNEDVKQALKDAYPCV